MASNIGGSGASILIREFTILFLFYLSLSLCVFAVFGRVCVPFSLSLLFHRFLLQVVDTTVKPPSSQLHKLRACVSLWLNFNTDQLQKKRQN